MFVPVWVLTNRHGHGIVVSAIRNYGRAWHMYRTTLKWMRESRLPYMASVAKEVGVDMTGWTFGQHFGQCYTLVDADMNRYGTWKTLAGAEKGTDDMISAWQAVIDARKGN